MKDLAGKVAVVTGAASGIGLALAKRFAGEGMKVVLADVESGPLTEAEAAIKAKGAAALAVRTDVMREEEVKRLADAAFGAWGNVHVLCNNAGVAGSGVSADGIWNVAREDWDWVLGVNFWGVLHGIRHFVPRMLDKAEAGHIVNTASTAGLATSREIAVPYTVSKHGVVALSEVLYKDLRARDSKLSASVLCPGWVNTNIIDSARNLPDSLRSTAAAAPTQQDLVRLAMVRGLLKEGLQPEEIAERVVGAIRSDTFYIVPAQPEIEKLLALRLEDIRLRRNPSLPPIA